MARSVAKIKSSRTRVEKRSEVVSPTKRALQSAHKNLYTTHEGSPLGMESLTPNILSISVKNEKTNNNEVLGMLIHRV